mmetsp:Transcript_125979/g.251428  ORF Transcript_125979/g.251428 Transcript_125979/m.251428 type:complete len:127 (+) Transcript_125979:874-1254(+)
MEVEGEGVVAGAQQVSAARTAGTVAMIEALIVVATGAATALQSRGPATVNVTATGTEVHFQVKLAETGEIAVAAEFQRTTVAEAVAARGRLARAQHVVIAENPVSAAGEVVEVDAVLWFQSEVWAD